MDEPLPKWVGVIILLASLATLAGVFVLAHRNERRRRELLRAEVLHKIALAAGRPLDERQAELLRHGVLPWYEFPNFGPGGRPPAGPTPEAASPSGEGEPRGGEPGTTPAAPRDAPPR